MSNNTITLIIDSYTPSLTDGIAEVVRVAIADHINQNKNLIDELKEITVKINAEERKDEETSSPIPLGSTVLISDSEENIDSCPRTGILVGCCSTDIYPFQVIGEAINWSSYEGQEIEVCDHCLDKWIKKTLYKYDSTMEWPFICFLDNGEGVLSWKTARLIEKKEPEVDWSKVPMGTKVFVADADNEETIKAEDLPEWEKK